MNAWHWYGNKLSVIYTCSVDIKKYVLRFKFLSWRLFVKIYAACCKRCFGWVQFCILNIFIYLKVSRSNFVFCTVFNIFHQRFFFKVWNLSMNSKAVLMSQCHWICFNNEGISYMFEWMLIDIGNLPLNHCWMNIRAGVFLKNTN